VQSRRKFLKTTGIVAGATLLPSRDVLVDALRADDTAPADYTLHIKAAPVEIAPKRIVSAVTYNGQFPGPLLRFKEGRLATVDVFNHTDTPEQLHWHGQQVPVEVDGAAEEGTPFIPALGHRRIVFTPRPAGLRFYHTHNRAGADLSAGQ
jgi:FtsP/CotA-like multicopper oxidase with cupredoxin domain